MLKPSKILTMPVMAPIGGLTWLARQIAEAAVTEWLDPTRIEAALLKLEQRLERGEIDEATYEAEEAVQLDELRTIRAALAETPDPAEDEE